MEEAKQNTHPEQGAAGISGWSVRKKILAAVLLVLFIALCAAGTAAAYAWNNVNRVLESVQPDSDAADIADEVKTAPEVQADVVNVLICGIDNEEGRSYGEGTEGLRSAAMTDMILYFQFDVKQNKVNMLQIPRNTYVGTSFTCTDTTGKTYKASNGQINSIAKSNPEGIAALADTIANNYKLPVDYYATLEMEALKDIVDKFGGINVYIPFDIEYKNSRLEQGYHTLMGDQVEFLVRNRESYAQQDIARLNVQRYFYAALFRRVRTANLAEIWHMMPTVSYYVKTDMPADVIVGLAYKFLSVESSNIMIAQTPVNVGSKQLMIGSQGQAVVVADREDIADLLNTYYRAYMDEVPPEELNVDDTWPYTDYATSANVQYMGQLDEERAAAIAGGNTDVIFDY